MVLDRHNVRNLGCRFFRQPSLSLFFFSLMAFALLSGGCKLSTEDPVAAAPPGLRGFWVDETTPPRYWILGESKAVIDSTFDPSAGVYVVRSASFELKDKALKFGSPKHGQAVQEYTMEKVDGPKLSIRKGATTIDLRRMTDKEVGRVFGAKYAADPQLWLTDIENGTYKP